MRQRCEWRLSRKRWAGNFGDFWKEQLVEIWLWARRVEIFILGRAASWGLTEERCRNSQHSKNGVSLSSSRKTKSKKKLIYISYLNYRESSVFREFPCIRIFYISVYLYCCILDMLHSYCRAKDLVKNEN